VRFADLDPNQHVNNAVYATYFETGRVTLMKDRSYGLMPPGLAWIMVRLDIHFRAELRWPGTIEMGLGVSKFEDLRHFRSGGVFARPLRGVGAIGDGADRRGQAQADAADAGDHREFPALASPRIGKASEGRTALIKLFSREGNENEVQSDACDAGCGNQHCRDASARCRCCRDLANGVMA
jgi:acyl-CoA thioester hydrolase